MRVLAEIPARPVHEPATGTLRRSDLEAFGSLLEQLRDARVVLLAGEAPGRRQAAAGLAAAAVAGGTSTALVECDLARPGLADALGLANAPGLHEHLEGDAEAGDVLKAVVLAGPGSGAATDPLACVVAGRPSEEGSRLFASEAFAAMLAGLRAAYDLVVLDGPRVAEWGSLSLLTGQADATLVCVGAAEPLPEQLPIPATGLVVQA